MCNWKRRRSNCSQPQQLSSLPMDSELQHSIYIDIIWHQSINIQFLEKNSHWLHLAPNFIGNSTISLSPRLQLPICGRHVKGISTASFARPLWSLEIMASYQKCWKMMIKWDKSNENDDYTIEFQGYFPFWDMFGQAQVSQCWLELSLVD